MTLLAMLSLHLFLLLYITLVLQAESPPITCEAGTFTVGNTASIICDFGTDVGTVGHAISMAKYLLDFQRNDMGKDVLLCPLSTETKKHRCSLEMANYTFDGNLTNHITVRIPEVLPEHEGWYMCFFVPAGGTESYPCKLRVQAKPESRSTAKPVSLSTEKPEDSQALLPILLPVLLVLAAGGCVLGVVFCLRRRRATRKPEAASEAMIPQNEEEQETSIWTDVHSRDDKVERYLRDFQLWRSKTVELQNSLVQELGKALTDGTKDDAEARMLRTFVSPLHDKAPEPAFQKKTETTLVLDINDTTLKASLVRLEGHVASIVKSELYSLQYEISKGVTVTEMFDLIAKWTDDFILDERISPNTPLVLILAFPCRHQSVREARLVKWTKEVKTKEVTTKEVPTKEVTSKAVQCEGSDGLGVHTLLYEAFDKRTRRKKFTPKHVVNLRKLNLVCIVNDTVSTLMSGVYSDTHSNCRIALILDTGLNACYLEDWKHPDKSENKPEMIINTELGALGENGCLEFCRTEVDRELDEHSTNPGSQILEKMVSGLYLGEIVRLTLRRLTKERLVFQSVPLGSALVQKGMFTTKFVIEIESDTEEPYPKTRGVLDTLGVTGYTEDDVETVRRVCSVVSERAAFLTAAGLAALINHVDQPEVTVVVDGYLYHSHPRFHDLMYSHLQTWLNKGISFSLVSPFCDRAVGAAHIAADLPPTQRVPKESR